MSKYKEGTLIHTLSHEVEHYNLDVVLTLLELLCLDKSKEEEADQGYWLDKAQGLSDLSTKVSIMERDQCLGETMQTIKPSKMRAIIKERFPDLVFKLKTVGFSDLARGSKVFLESSAWGMCKGNSDTFQAVKAYAEYKELPIIVSF